MRSGIRFARHLARKPGGKFVAALVCGTVAVSGVALAQSSALRIGTSSSGSVFYALAVGLGKMLQEHTKISATAEPVGGSDANMFAIAANKVDLAIANSGASYSAYHGMKPFRHPIGIGLIAQGQPSYRQIIVRTGSGINSPADLAGKTIIGKRPALPEIGAITNALLKVYDIDPGKVNIVTTTNTGEAVKALKSNTVDAVVIPGSKGASYLQSLAHDGKIRFLSIPSDKIEAMDKYLPKYLSTGVLPAGTYEGQDKPVNVFVLTTYLVAASRVPEDTVYKVTKTLFQNLDEFYTLHSAAKKWTLAQTFDNPKIPFHPGAVRYFKEKNIWPAKLDDLQGEYPAKK